MALKTLKECVLLLEQNNELLRIKEEVDPFLVMAEIHRQVNSKNGPAIYFEKVKNSPFPAVSNLFGNLKRAELLLQPSLDRLSDVVQLKSNPAFFLRHPFRLLKALIWGTKSLPLPSFFPAVKYAKTTIDQLPQIQCWPQDGGAFITLPQVYSEDPKQKSLFTSNIGMYRVQLSGNSYQKNAQIGMHYQTHRGLGIHHTRAIARNQKLPVSIFVGGAPALTLGAVMPLPEGLAELTFMGMLAGRNFRYAREKSSEAHYILSADADFCITGTIDPHKLLPEGPFGDHLGYYSLKHLFPYVEVDAVYHKKDAIWPFTVVGRPPQEDSIFGKLIHQLTLKMVSKVLPGVKALHAVDVAGVHPLLLAIGSERYVPYDKKIPREILTQAHAILGFGQASLAKYLIIADDAPGLNLKNEKDFFKYILERLDFTRDLHFTTETTMDTLDYSSSELNVGSKVVLACAGPKIRNLGMEFEQIDLPVGFRNPRIVVPGIVAIEGPKFHDYKESELLFQTWQNFSKESWRNFPLLIICDDADFVAENFANFLWVTFTRSNPSHDIYGIQSFINYKHWGCAGSLIIDSRLKPHHAPPLEVSEEITSSAQKILERASFQA